LSLLRVGTGYDSHRFAGDRPLILGGITIPFDRGLTGHSDADAICHAVTDAMLGAAALGDIGTHFPPSDEKWKGADSAELLRMTRVLLEERGFHVVNVDVTVICEAPKIGPYVVAIRERLAEILAIDVGRVSIKGKTNEGMGWIGRGEGIATMASVLIETTET
jgi:2-C-methyl-D-erythritol 2,4-cyclodiphosphate synthase